MAEYYINDTTPIDWNLRGAEKIAQNCQILLCTFLFEVAYERAKGMDPVIVDLPLPDAIRKMKSEVYRVIRTYEPRAKVMSVNVWGEESGDLHFTVGLDITVG